MVHTNVNVKLASLVTAILAQVKSKSYSIGANIGMFEK